ncbi:hypothetical protein DFH08DRAFT_778823 [Mycena albidolilacea]|uniref:Protein kinase domain-containing protein n=1 Tax=Mycena albidolilacea TaxID=1033008 RepID=A0AAD7ESX2_9AGAR|nr:hypothetical protein DFH08DRAFT_778823 [Mycena albidolilacea]
MRLCRTYGLHPTCFALTGVEQIGEHPMAAGGVADIYKGLSRGQCVSIKASRPFNNNIPAVIKQLGHGSLIWRQLPCHPNLPPSPGPSHFHRELAIVSPWMENGNIEEYLDKKPSDTPPFPDLILVLKILDVALGLEFLHVSNVVHGDLQPVSPYSNYCSPAMICTTQHPYNSLGSGLYFLFRCLFDGWIRLPL